MSFGSHQCDLDRNVNRGGGDARDFHVFPVLSGAHPCPMLVKPQWPENPDRNAGPIN